MTTEPTATISPVEDRGGLLACYYGNKTDRHDIKWRISLTQGDIKKVVIVYCDPANTGNAAEISRQVLAQFNEGNAAVETPGEWSLEGEAVDALAEIIKLEAERLNATMLQAAGPASFYNGIAASASLSCFSY